MVASKKGKIYDVIIIGGGCTGLGAAMYAGRFGMKTLVIADNIGGTIILTDVVENYPGFTRLTGQELADNLLKHAKEYPSVEFLEEKATGITSTGEGFEVAAAGKKYASHAIIYATGTVWRKLGVPGETALA